MKKRNVAFNKVITYTFYNNTDPNNEGMVIEKNGVELGVYSNFEYDDTLDDSYLMELALEFEEILAD
jgi:hypothetical protein